MGNRGSERGGPGRDARPPTTNRRVATTVARRPVPLPAIVARRARFHSIVPEKPFSVGTPPRHPDHGDGLGVDELLTAWVANAQGVHEPDTLDDCADYARYLEERDRAAHDAGELCRRLRERLATWIAAQRGPTPTT